MHMALADSLDILGLAYEYHAYTGNHTNQMNIRIPIAFAFLDSVMNTGIEEGHVTKPVEQMSIGATIFRGPLVLPGDKMYQVFDITGREIDVNRMSPGIYFITNDGMITQKVIKVE
jgi:hypothetical protein